ncbi:MAG TPA: 50S ribosomal protein L19 [Victivallales bacterium]|nr:50S ribosomal protein L19 [Victivallales bacterium]HRR28277.1 50S ribosomal protein L19 [Victivallales bacterium]HRU00360.1 50S ribosomal protein L19 [Victivallales bacterium]
MNILDKINQKECTRAKADFNIGDTIRVHTKIIEGDSERIQVFSGVVIARKGSGIKETFTVRRVAYGQGMEKVFPLHSPKIDKIEVERRGKVRRAKLYYLKSKVGKDSKVKDLTFNKTAQKESPQEETNE